MAIVTKRSHTSNGDRYQFDFERCNYKQGWAQVDTASDAWYYGNWANPLERKMVSYVEGDICETSADTDEEFCHLVRECIEWHQKNETWKGIDGMCNEAIISRFEEMGLGEYLH